MTRAKFAVASSAVIAAVGFVFFRSSQPPAAEVTEARTESVTSTLAVSGVLEAVDRTTVASQIGGARVARVLVDIGQRVREGDPLVEFEASEFEAQVRAAEAAIAQAEAGIALQRVNAGNAEQSLSLAQQGLNEVTDLRLAVAQAETQLRTARQRLAQAQANRDRVRNAARTEQIQQAEAQRDRAKLQRDQRAREFARAEALLAEGVIARASWELAQTALRSAEEDVRIAEEALALARTPRSEDLRQAEAQLDEAQASVTGAQSVLQLAQKNLSQRLANRQQVVSAQTQRDAAKAQSAVSQAQRQAGIAQLETARANLAKTVVRAPFAGRVADRLIEPGQTAALGTPLIQLANEQALRVRLDVDEASLSELRVGEAATVSFDAFPDLRLKAEVAEIGSAANFQRGTVEVRLRLLQTDPRLKPDLTADANIVTGTFAQAVVIPRRALVNPDAEAQVYVLEDGTVQAKSVRWTRGDLDNAVVLEGLSAGERVLLEPRSFRPGQRVTPIALRNPGGR